MTDKVQKLREEVERLKEETSIGLSEYENGVEQGRMEIINALSIFIDSLQEEPVSEQNLSNIQRTIKDWKEESVSNPIDFEKELYKAFGRVKDFTLGMRIAKWFYDMGKKSREPISEDLGEYINEISKQFPEVSFAKLSRIAVRVAKWQKQQDQSTIELAEDHAMLAGMEKMKEQMMAKAVDATIGLPYENKNGGYTHLVDVSIPLPVGDNKIAIIFKED